MRAFLAILSLGLCLAAPAAAQTVPELANVVAACGTPNSTYPVNATKAVTVDPTGKICNNVTAATATLTLTVIAPTDRGGSIAAGGTSQNAMAANASRKDCLIENPVNATEDLYISSTAAAVVAGTTPNDASLSPGGSWSCLRGPGIITTAIRVNALTTGHTYLAKESQ